MNNLEVMNAGPIDTKADNREVSGKTTRQEVDPNINQIGDKSSTEKIEVDPEKITTQKEIVDLKNRVVILETTLKATIDQLETMHVLYKKPLDQEKS